MVGKRVVDLSPAGFADLRARYRAVLLDVGTGDGKHVLHLARNRPDWLIVGLDANADRMRKASSRAAANPARGGLPNAIFVWAPVERLPAELRDVRELHVLMPWGSLLRGAVGGDEAILTRLAQACAPGAAFLVTLNLHAWRPPVPEVGDLPEPTPDWATGELARRYAAAGLRLDEATYLHQSEIEALATSWTKRLGSSRAALDVLALRGTARPS